MNERTIRAVYDSYTITVYQAYQKEIAQSAVKNQRFLSPFFSKKRMTWIKPSFLWMMYRSGWATKKNQEHILAIKIKRAGFEWALENSCLSHFDPRIYPSNADWKERLKNSPVRIQWDPERNLFLQPLKYRSIQIGLSESAVEKYLSEWIVSIDDITAHCKHICSLIELEKFDEANSLLPKERNLYNLAESINKKINYGSSPL